MRRQLLSIYEGVVERADDPEARNRVQVRVHGVHGRADDGGSSRGDLAWARLAGPTQGSGAGQVKPPSVGEEVLVAYVQGHVDHPIVLGSWSTGLDQRNGNESGYVAGPSSKVVEGDASEHSGGSRRISARADFLVEVLGVALRSAGEIVDTTTGARKLTAGYEEVDIKGDSTRKVRGATKWKHLADYAMSVVGKGRWSFGLGLEVLALGGMELKTYLNTIDLTAIFGEVVIGVSDATGLVDLAKATFGTLGTVLVEALLNVTVDAPTVQLGSPAAVDPVALSSLVLASDQGLATSINVLAAQLQALGMPGTVAVASPSAATRVFGI